MAMSAAERQRKRRRNLKNNGIVDVTVKVPESARASLQALAKDLCAHPERPVAANRLARVVATLRSNQDALKQSGIKHAAVFGSTVRGEDRPESDIDILIDYDTSVIGGLYGFMDVLDEIKNAVHRDYPDVEVDVADLQALKDSIRNNVECEALYVF